MIESIQKTSLLVPSQLPEWIRDDPNYQNFVSFLQAYYAWMEENNNVLDYSKNIPNYQDIDNTTNDFIQYFVNDFLPYFPEDTLVDQRKLVKYAKEFYKTKGIPASFSFLFRVLYNSDFDVYNTKDVILRASAGTWLIFKSLKLSTSDENFLNTNNYRIFGESTKSIATIENSVISGNKIEIFISNMERLFQSGEYAKIVDSRNQDVYFLNGEQVDPSTPGAEILRAKIVGQISQINIDPNNRGSFYEPGDPVVVYGGLDSPLGVGASAEVGTTTAGGVKSISVLNGGFGYSNYPNTVIQFSNLNSGAKTPIAVVGSLSPYELPIISINNGGQGYQNNDVIYTTINSNPYNFAYVSNVDANGKILSITYNSGVSPNSVIGVTANVSSANALANGASIVIANSAGSAIANVTLAPTNSLGFAKNVPLGNSIYGFANPSSNANTTFANGLSFTTFSTYPISSVIVQNQGGGITQSPTVTAISEYVTDDSTNPASLNNLGILAPIQIIQGGVGYVANDRIVFSGGSGYGAHANVTSVDSKGKIISISYVYGKEILPLGGMGYDIALPTLTVQSANANATGSSIVVTGTLGSGATFSAVTDRAGAITTINVLDYGEDYIATPNVSLKVMDIVVSNLLVTQPPIKGDFIYQGTSSNNTTFQAYVDSYSPLQSDADPTKSLYNLRLYEYTSLPSSSSQLKIDRNSINLNIAGVIPSGSENNPYPTPNYTSGIPGLKVYGDGTAKATAKFLNGLVIGEGQYLNSQGQPSSFNVLQSQTYNNFTYQITVEKEIAKYRDILLGLLHPTGTNVIGRYAMENEDNYNFHSLDALSTGLPLTHYTGYSGSSVNMVTDFTNKSNNILSFSNLAGANIASFISNTNTIEVVSANGPYIKAEVLSVNEAANTVTLKDNTWLTFANVAYVSTNTVANFININTLTGQYDIINNGEYSNTAYPLKDIVYAGDTVRITGNTTTFTVTNVNYNNGWLYVTPGLPSVSNSLLTVKRTFGPVYADQVIIYGPVGTQYIPELVTEDGISITTQDGKILILG